MELDSREIDLVGCKPTVEIEGLGGIRVGREAENVVFTKKNLGNVKAEGDVEEKEYEVSSLLNVPDCVVGADVEAGVVVETVTTWEEVVPSLVAAWVDEDSEVRSVVELGAVVEETSCVVADVVGDFVTEALVETTAVVETEVEDGATETELEGEVVAGSEVTTVLEATLELALGASEDVEFDPACLFANSTTAFAFAASTKACATLGSCL